MELGLVRCLTGLSAALDRRARTGHVRDDGFSPLFRADAAVYLAAAHRALGNSAPADTWQARAMQSYLQSMSAEQAERRAQAWIRE